MTTLGRRHRGPSCLIPFASTLPPSFCATVGTSLCPRNWPPTRVFERYTHLIDDELDQSYHEIFNE